MQNVEIKTEGKKVVITVDSSKDFGLSSTGKTHIVASTGGFVQVAELGIGINLTVVRKG